jgi:uncharacterized membrane protein YbhN (UPF0104 family)
MFKNKHVQFTFFFATGVLLVYLTFRKISFSDLIQTLKQANYWVSIPVFAFSMLGYYARVYRWKMMLNALGSNTKLQHLYAALCMGYGVNFVVPRLGELTRCIIVKKTDSIRFDKALLTIVIERLLDTFILFFLIMITTFLFANRISQFTNENIIQPILDKFGNMGMYAIIGLIITIFLVIITIVLSASAKGLLRQYFDMFEKIAYAAKNLHFWIATVAIWLCYLMMTFLWFYAFESTQNLTIADAFFLMVVGSIGRSIPIQGGGMGAYHFLIAQAGLLFGLSLVDGNALAVIIHGAQSVLTIVLALISYIWFLSHIK